MKQLLVLTPDPLDEVALVAGRTLGSDMGAVLYFSGAVRDREGSEPIAGLEYESFRPMVEHQFGLLFEELERRWPHISSIRVVHRIGRVVAGEISLWIEVIAPHRAEAFASSQWLIDEMKRVVPIWKRPYLAP